MRARQDGEPDDVHVFFDGCCSDGVGGEANAVIDDVHTGIAGARRDLFGAVGMAVEPGLADQKLQAAAELFRHAVDLGADVIESLGVVTHGGADPGRRPIFAECGSRGAPPHSPVVTPALAQVIEAGMMLAPLFAAWRSFSSAAATALPSRWSRHACNRAT